MPTTIEAVQCHCCERAIRPRDSSIFEGLCNQCYEAHYMLCTDCGILICRSQRLEDCDSNRARPRGYHAGGSLHCYDNAYYCFDCYNQRRGYNRADYWKPTPFGASFATYNRIGSKRKYGVEVETSYCRRREQLCGHTHFGCKDDPTVTGAEFDSPILYGDEGLKHIEDFLVFARRENWSVDSDCGCHTHYDMRDESSEHLYRIAYAYALTHRMWVCCVPQHRVHNSYCHPPRYSCQSIVAASDSVPFICFARSRNRYDYVNLNAYNCHKTFEIRLLEGSIDPTVICNWLTLHCRFIDQVKKMPLDVLRASFRGVASNVQFRALANLIDSPDLIEWLADRARHVGQRPLRGPGCVIRSLTSRRARRL